jgi:hypothetical protein
MTTYPFTGTQSRTTTLLAEILKIDPNYLQDSENVTVFKFSNGREFKEYWRQQGPYNVVIT